MPLLCLDFLSLRECNGISRKGFVSFSQAEGREFEPRRPLQYNKDLALEQTGTPGRFFNYTERFYKFCSISVFGAPTK